MRVAILLFFLSLSLRLGVLFLVPRDLIPPNPDWETGAVSISLATTGEFANPYLIPTGPTAHMPPLYVATMSLVYRALGTGFLGGLVRWILVAIAYSLLVALMPWLGELLGMGRKAGILAGIAGSFFLTFPAELEPFSGLVLALIAVSFLARWRGLRKSGRRFGSSFWLGLGLGVAFHLQPVFLPVVLGCVAFEVWWWRGHRAWRRAGLIALGVLVACVPWGLRNYATFHQLFFIRSNLGLELYVGNHDNAHGDIEISEARRSFQHPRTDLGEAEQVRALGEGSYMMEKQREALDWIRAHPGEFLKLTGARLVYFWFGPIHQASRALPYLVLTVLAVLGAWRCLPSADPFQRAALLVPLATYPLIYYVVAYMPRYGEPVRWILLLLAAGALTGVGRGRPPARSGGTRPAAS